MQPGVGEAAPSLRLVAAAWHRSTASGPQAHVDSCERPRAGPGRWESATRTRPATATATAISTATVISTGHDTTTTTTTTTTTPARGALGILRSPAAPVRSSSSPAQPSCSHSRASPAGRMPAASKICFHSTASPRGRGAPRHCAGTDQTLCLSHHAHSDTHVPQAIYGAA